MVETKTGERGGAERRRGGAVVGGGSALKTPEGGEDYHLDHSVSSAAHVMDQDRNGYSDECLPNSLGVAAMSHQETKTMLQIGSTNAIGFYGACVHRVHEQIEQGDAPTDLFDEVSVEVMNDLNLDVFPRFVKSPFFQRFIRTKTIEEQDLSIRDFEVFRALGRGGFGTVSKWIRSFPFCRKRGSSMWMRDAFSWSFSSITFSYSECGS